MDLGYADSDFEWYFVLAFHVKVGKLKISLSSAVEFVLLVDQHLFVCCL